MKIFKKLLLSLCVGCSMIAITSCNAQHNDKPHIKDDDIVIVDDETSELNKLKMPLLKDTRPQEKEMTTITTILGDEVTYNKNSRRIVCLSSGGDFVALGMRPLAVTGHTLTDGYDDFFRGVSKLNHTQPFSSEELMNYKPDIIVTYATMNYAQIKKLEKVAKEAVLPVYFDEYDPKTRLGLIGSYFGLEENANKMIEYANSVKEKGEHEIKSLGLEGKTLTVFSFFSNGVCIPPTFKNGWVFTKILYTDLKFKKTQKVQEYLDDKVSQAYMPINSEVLRKYESEINLFADLSTFNGQKVEEVPNIVKENAGWKTLQCVKQNKVGVFNAMLFSAKDVLFIQNQYSILIDALKKTI